MGIIMIVVRLLAARAMVTLVTIILMFQDELVQSESFKFPNILNFIFLLWWHCRSLGQGGRGKISFYIIKPSKVTSMILY